MYQPGSLDTQTTSSEEEMQSRISEWKRVRQAWVLPGDSGLEKFLPGIVQRQLGCPVQSSSAAQARPALARSVSGPSTSAHSVSLHNSSGGVLPQPKKIRISLAELRDTLKLPSQHSWALMSTPFSSLIDPVVTTCCKMQEHFPLDHVFFVIAEPDPQSDGAMT
jgi:hypothetical protein